jgi:hypothetical protein
MFFERLLENPNLVLPNYPQILLERLAKLYSDWVPYYTFGDATFRIDEREDGLIVHPFAGDLNLLPQIASLFRNRGKPIYLLNFEEKGTMREAWVLVSLSLEEIIASYRKVEDTFYLPYFPSSDFALPSEVKINEFFVWIKGGLQIDAGEFVELINYLLDRKGILVIENPPLSEKKLIVEMKTFSDVPPFEIQPVNFYFEEIKANGKITDNLEFRIGNQKLVFQP